MTSCLSWTSVVFQESSNETLPGFSESDFLALACSKINKRRNYISNQNRSKSTGIEKLFSYTDMVLSFQTMSQFGRLFPLIWNSTLTVIDLEILYRHLTLGERSQLGSWKKPQHFREVTSPTMTHAHRDCFNESIISCFNVSWHSSHTAISLYRSILQTWHIKKKQSQQFECVNSNRISSSKATGEKIILSYHTYEHV